MTKRARKEDKMLSIYQQYSYTEYNQALDDVFHSVFFDDVELRNILWDSYRINLWDIALYAVDNKIDEIKHIHSIQRNLLKIPGCRLRRMRINANQR